MWNTNVEKCHANMLTHIEVLKVYKNMEMALTACFMAQCKTADLSGVSLSSVSPSRPIYSTSVEASGGFGSDRRSSNDWGTSERRVGVMRDRAVFPAPSFSWALAP